MIEYKCEICGRDFSRKEYLTQHLKFGKHLSCRCCGKIIDHDGFCSQSCAAKFNNKKRGPMSEEQKKKISETLKSKAPKTKALKVKAPKIRFCKTCGIQIPNTHKYCEVHRKQRLSESGRKGSTSLKNVRRSRNETYFAELIHQKYNDSIENVAMFDGWDADVIIPSLKIAILWNGKWHYEDIMGGLKQIQNRDKIKYGKIVAFGYMPYIITDLGKFSKAKCEAEFKRFEEFLNCLKASSSAILLRRQK